MIKGKTHYGCQGSFYHVGENTSSDLVVTSQMPNSEFGTDITVEVGDKRIHLAHDIGWSLSPVSKSTRPMSELVSVKLHDERYGHLDLLVRAHRHEYLELETRLGKMVVCPCWKARDAFAARKGLSMCPDIGYLYMEVGSDIEIVCRKFDLSPEAYIRCVK